MKEGKQMGKKEAVEAEGKATEGKAGSAKGVLKDTMLWAMRAVLWLLYWTLWATAVILTVTSVLPLLAANLVTLSGIAGDSAWYAWAELSVIPYLFACGMLFAGELALARLCTKRFSGLLARKLGGNGGERAAH